MPRPKIYQVRLTDEEVKKLKLLIRKKTTSKTISLHCQIILDMDENHGKILTHEQCRKINGVCCATVSNTVAGYTRYGMDYVTSIKRNANSDNARRKVDAGTAAKIIKMACEPVPQGYTRWTLRLLEERMKGTMKDAVGKDAIRRTLKNVNLNLKEVVKYNSYPEQNNRTAVDKKVVQI